MPKRTTGLMIAVASMLILSALFLNLLAAVPARSHGGKTHAEAFTAFQALGKGTDLYDRLIQSGKLDEGWETGLKTVHIDIRTGAAGKREYIVQFERTGGEPGSVFFFFDQSGGYSGSNFTGE